MIIFHFWLARTPDILQIAAVSGNEEMNVYMRPTTQICLEASAATRLTYIGGVLKHKGQTVTSVPPEDGLRYFLEFLKKFFKPILVGHNVQNFDVPVLVNQLAKYGLLEHFKENVSGFLDRMELAKKKSGKKGLM
ncbi:uncharacterized protein LOC134253076 [Saccostrea cucullata]|uniref:uncharacterized protein LOC134253076 n=1 Tax=Saccostrea cuccullata TaxID=36930 RepID=UPI002ED551F2